MCIKGTVKQANQPIIRTGRNPGAAGRCIAGKNQAFSPLNTLRGAPRCFVPVGRKGERIFSLRDKGDSTHDGEFLQKRKVLRLYGWCIWEFGIRNSEFGVRNLEFGVS